MIPAQIPPGVAARCAGSPVPAASLAVFGIIPRGVGAQVVNS